MSLSNTSTDDGHDRGFESQEMSAVELQIQAQEHVFKQTLAKEKPKVGRHVLDEIGRSLNAIAQRRRQYFLDYKNCNSIRSVRQWHAWESKRNLEMNALESRSDNAATKGIKMFLHRVSFYSTLLVRFEEYILEPLNKNFATADGNNPDLEGIKLNMNHLKNKCELMLSDNTEISLESENHSESEKRFPVISVLSRAHDIINKMVMMAFQWRIHARYEQQFEWITSKKIFMESEKDLSEKKRTLRDLEHQIRKVRRSHEMLETEIADRRAAISTSDFADEYEKCVDQIEAVRGAFDECQANIHVTDNAIKSFQQNLGKYKIVGAKKKQKLESSLIRRTRKAEELSNIKAELDKLENQKARLDEEEMAWLRGGYENAEGVIESLKEQSIILQNNLSTLIKQKSDMKESYDEAVEKIMKLNAEHEELSHKYEYMKRLASMAVRHFQKYPEKQINVKPNKISLTKAEAEGAYEMVQPKGVVMIITNNWEAKPTKEGSPRPNTEAKSVLAKLLGDLCTQFGYYVIQRQDLTTQAIRQHMVGLSDQYHGYQGNHNSMLVFLATKTNVNGQILDSNEGVLSVNSLLEHFVQSRCPALIGKPKIFLLLLKVTSKEPSLSSLSNSQSQIFKRKPLSRVDPDSGIFFDPENIAIDDDFLVVRVMYEEKSSFSETPTFGGVTNTAEEEVPWFAETFIRFLANQSGTTDLLTIVNNIKKEFRTQITSMVSGKNTTASVKSSSSILLKPAFDPGHVNVFVDHKLKRDVYLMPGL